MSMCEGAYDVPRNEVVVTTEQGTTKEKKGWNRQKWTRQAEQKARDELKKILAPWK